MSDPAPPKRRNLPPTKRKREMPPDAPHQLLVGRPSSGLEQEVWRSLNHPSQDMVDRYGANRFELVRYIREVALRLYKLARVRDWQPGLFYVSDDGKGHRHIDARPPGVPALELFTRISREKAAAASVHYPDCDLHPYFSLLFRIIKSEPFYRISGAPRSIGEIADRYFSSHSPSRFFNDVGIYDVCDALNSFFADLYKSTRDSREKVKSFRRVAQENRRSLMQYAVHLLDGEQNLNIAHLTIRRDVTVIGGAPPISRKAIEEIRHKLVNHVKREFREGEYLGHAILLKRDAILGCWLEAFVFYCGNPLERASDVVEKAVGRWNAQIGLGRAGCIGEVLPRQVHRPDRLYQRALDKITLVTEADFYCRVSAMGLHRFWCSQSPVGKLAERTKQSKRREAEARRAAEAESSPIGRLQQMKLTDLGFEQTDRWTSQRDRHEKRISAKRKKAAKKRTSKKGAAPGITPSSLQTDHYAASSAHAKSASGPLADPVSAIAPVVTNTVSDALGHNTSSASVVSQHTPENTSPPSTRAEAEAHAPSAAATPTTTSIRRHPISLQRQQKQITESDSNRERSKVEVRKKRTDPSRKPPNEIPDQ